ncbi:MAG: hypothetical protein U9O56_10410 [Campylobacterota bacterium]|nr:hypothetical protein [Campylobacterota bacterium]
MRECGLYVSTNPIFKHMQERVEKTIEEKNHKIDTIIIDGYQKLTKNEKYTHKRKFAILKRLAIKYNIKVIVIMDLFMARNPKVAEKGYIDNNDIYDYDEFKSFVDFGYGVTAQNISLLLKDSKLDKKSDEENTALQLKQSDIFKIMAGSYEDKLELFSSDEVMKSIDLQTIKNIYQEKYKKLNKACDIDRDNMYEELIKFLQYLAYNKDYSQHRQEIATFVFDRLFEQMSENFI